MEDVLRLAVLASTLLTILQLVLVLASPPLR
jgi:hypothetical protein